jgi:hypothetical protein
VPGEILDVFQTSLQARLAAAPGCRINLQNLLRKKS